MNPLPVASTPAAWSSRSAVTGELLVATSNSLPPTWEPSAKLTTIAPPASRWTALVGAQSRRSIPCSARVPATSAATSGSSQRKQLARALEHDRLAAKQREHGSDHRPQMSCRPVRPARRLLRLRPDPPSSANAESGAAVKSIIRVGLRCEPDVIGRDGRLRCWIRPAEYLPGATGLPRRRWWRGMTGRGCRRSSTATRRRSRRRAPPWSRPLRCRRDRLGTGPG
jgi:hypothetical protein